MGLIKKMQNLQSALEQGMANVEAATQAMTGSDEPSWLLDKPLRGPAGQYVYGQHLGSAQRQALLAPVQLAADREGQLRAEFDERARARTPYLAPTRDAVRVTRFTTAERHQVEHVTEHLARSGFAARPDLVFGLFRVPDHIDSGTLGGGGADRLVEWDLVHRDVAALPPAPAPGVVWFDANDQWVARRIGEPMVHDEDLALSYLAQAGLGPEHTIGISRFLNIHHEPAASGEASHTASYVTGMHAWHLPGYGTEAFDMMRSGRPLPIVASPGTHLVALSWSSIRRAVAPVSGQPVIAPSPFPYLPATPQELLSTYLDIVGIRSTDCYAASVTEDAPKDLDSITYKGGVTLRTNRGEPQMCVDGVARPRLVGGARVVVAYRDHADYVVGRERFAAYERDVLRSRLELGAGRRPLEYDDALDRLPGGLRGLAKAAATTTRVLSLEGRTVFDKLPPYRYCWPPVS